MKRVIPILFVILALAGAVAYWWTRGGDRMINFSPNRTGNRIVGRLALPYPLYESGVLAS